MSTEEEIAEAVRSEALYKVRLEFPSDTVRRRMWLHRELRAELRVVYEEEGEEAQKRLASLEKDFESFVKEEHVLMGLKPFNHKNADFGLLSPVSKGLWDLRSRDPGPGLRVFGAFIGVDAFVALSWAPRSIGWGGKRQLGNADSIEYQIALLEAEERWNAALPNSSPIVGKLAHEYVSRNFSVVGD